MNNENQTNQESKSPIVSLEELNAISDAYSEITEPKEFMKLFDHSDDFITWLKIGTPEDVLACLDRFKKARLRNAPKVIEQFLKDYTYNTESNTWEEFVFPTDLLEQPNPNQVTLEDAIIEAETAQDSKDAQGTGLGDVIEKVTEGTGLKKAVEKVSKFLGVDCGCDERKEEMNKVRIFQKLNPECLEDEEIEILQEYFSRRKDVISVEDQKTILPIYNRVLRRNYQMTNCAPCWRNILNTLESIMKYYR